MFRAMSIFSKISASFAVIIAIMIFTSVFGVSRIDSVNHISTEMENIYTPSIRYANRMIQYVAMFRQLEFQHDITDDDAAMRSIEGEMKEISGALEKTMREYESLPRAFVDQKTTRPSRQTGYATCPCTGSSSNSPARTRTRKHWSC